MRLNNKLKERPINRYSRAVADYLEKTDRFKPLTESEEAQMSAEILSGNEDSATKLILANTRFVIMTAMKYRNRGIEFLDLIQAGNIALIECARRFDSTITSKVIRYANRRIKGAILNEIDLHGRTIRIPGNVLSERNKTKEFMLTFLQENEREATNEEIAEFLQRSLEESALRTSTSASIVNLYDDEFYDSVRDIDEDDPASLAIFNEEKALYQQFLLECFSLLTEKQKLYIQLKYGMSGLVPLEASEIAEILGLTSSETVHESIRRSRSTIRKHYGEEAKIHDLIPS